ncbi:MAG: diguanylate cyclase [Myxococcota bacterium]|nr:diguanylate cyclase [Myxococcota bacterium]
MGEPDDKDDGEVSGGRDPKDTVAAPNAAEWAREETDQVDLGPMVQEMLRSEAGDKIPVFVVLSGTDVGSVVRLDRGAIVLGRDPTSGAVFQDEGVSRQHLKAVLLPGGRVAIEDLGSTNGTVVHGQRIARAILAVGDKLLLGRRTILKLALLDKVDHAFQQEIYDSSIRDPLTGIYNRAYLLKRLATDLSFATRHSLPLSLLILDLDHFKHINDTYGHPCGDRLLCKVATTLFSGVRFEDVLGRYGGEEFALVASGVDESGARALGEKLRSLVTLCEVPVSDSPGAELVTVTVTIGSITVPGGIRLDPCSALEAADANLYAGKNSGRDRVVASTFKGGRESGQWERG